MKKYSVPALDKAFAILDYMADSSGGYTITEIHTHLQIPKATVFTIMNVLEELNIVKKDRNGKYDIGPKLYHLGMKYLSKNNLMEISRPHLIQLMETIGYTVHLGVLDEGKVLYIDKYEPNTFIRFSTFPGMRLDIHITGLGKAIAAFLDEETLRRVYPKPILQGYTAKTITTLEELRKNLQVVREKGYSFEDEEGEIGVRCIGAPIFDARGEVIAGISVAAHTSQLTPDLYTEIGEKVRGAALQISQDLGYKIS